LHEDVGDGLKWAYPAKNMKAMIACEKEGKVVVMIW
jgi:hypothetical protein